jgi:solute carrier family 30 (zinc transporter), member 1
MNRKIGTLYFILVLNVCVFFAELIVSIRTKSVALKADAFHVLSDAIATIITIYSISLVSKKKTPHATYGWLRSEIIGGLANSVFLLALAFNILIEAIEKLTNIDEIKEKLGNNIDEVFIVGFVGLGINLLSLVIVHHGHHDHGHNVHHHDVHDSETKKKKKNINIRGLWLHIIGDILGSVAVIISSSTIKYASGDFRFYLDPAVSLVTVGVIAIVTFPLLFKCRRILLHHVPKEIDMTKLSEDLSNITNIRDIHELHIWQLDDHKLVGSLHFNLHNPDSNIDIPTAICNTILEIKTVFHRYGIHSTTVQPEYHIKNINNNKFEDIDIVNCLEICQNDKDNKDDVLGEIRIKIKSDCIDVQCNEKCHEYKCCQ